MNLSYTEYARDKGRCVNGKMDGFKFILVLESSLTRLPFWHRQNPDSLWKQVRGLLFSLGWHSRLSLTCAVGQATVAWVLDGLAVPVASTRASLTGCCGCSGWNTWMSVRPGGSKYKADIYKSLWGKKRGITHLSNRIPSLVSYWKQDLQQPL